MRTSPRFRSLAPFMLFAVTMSAAIAIGMTRPHFPQTKSAEDSSQNFENGKKLFHARCGYCHLDGGTGTIMLGRRLGKDRALLEQRTDLTTAYVKKITRVGINGMPPHTRIEVPDNELDLIAAYITRPASARTPPPPSASDGVTHE
jgi:mono/diheme cytochrome c family protein